MKFKFSVKPSDCQFVINKNKKTITCIYTGCAKKFIKFVDDNTELIILNGFKRHAQLYNKMLMPNKFIGVATCGPDDEWDEKIGRLIAFSRMRDKLNRSFFKRAATFVSTMDKWIDDMVLLVNTVGEKLERNEDRRHKYIEELIGEKNKEDA